MNAADISTKINQLKDAIREDSDRPAANAIDAEVLKKEKQLAEVWCTGLDLLGGLLIDIKAIADAQAGGWRT